MHSSVAPDHGQAEHRLKIKMTMSICVSAWLAGWALISVTDSADWGVRGILAVFCVACVVGGVGWYALALSFTDVQSMAREVGRRAFLAYLGWLIVPLPLIAIGFFGFGQHFMPASILFQGLALLLLAWPIGAFWFTVKQAGRIASLCYNAQLASLRVQPPSSV